MERTATRPALLAVALLCLALVPAAPAFAHGDLKGSNPAAGDSLSVAPVELRLSFTEALEVAVTRLTLTGPNGPVAIGSLGVDPDSANVLIGRIDGPLVPGRYTVTWQVVSADGHPVRGEYSFVIDSAAQGLAQPADPAAENSATPSSGLPGAATEPLRSSNMMLWLIGAIVIAVIGVIGFRLFAGRPDDTAGNA